MSSEICKAAEEYSIGFPLYSSDTMDPLEEEERDVLGESAGNCGCALNRVTTSEHGTCSALVLYTNHTRPELPELSWEADSAWSLRMLRLLVEAARLKMLMAWCSTLGGAHSALGEHSISHAAQAGVISGQQLCLAVGLRDPLLATRCKLYLAYSLLQQGKLQQAAKLIRDQYKYVTKEAIVKDTKLVTMCLAAWERLHQLRRLKKRTALPEPSHDDDNTMS